MNNPDLSDVLARRSAIKVERDQLQQQDQALLAEDTDLAVAERVLLRLSPTLHAGPVGAVGPVSDPWLPLPPNPAETVVADNEALGSWADQSGWLTPTTIPRPVNGTQEEYTIWLLTGAVDPWATSNQIQAALSQILQRPIPMSSVSPMLTNMKNKGAIVRDNLKVALPSRAFQTRVAAE